MENEINKVIKRRTKLYQLQEIDIIKRTIMSLAGSLNIKLSKERGTLSFNGLVIFEQEINERNIFNNRTLSFLEGFRCAKENK